MLFLILDILYTILIWNINILDLIRRNKLSLDNFFEESTNLIERFLISKAN